MNASFVSFADEDHAAWASFVEECPEAWLYHRPEFVAAQAEDSSFSVRINGRIAAVCVLARKRYHRGHMLVGPGLAATESARRPAALATIGSELTRLALQKDCQAIQFELHPLAPALGGLCYPESVLATLGFGLGIRYAASPDYVHGFWSVVDLERDLATLLKDFRFGADRGVRRCQRQGFVVKVFDASNFVDAAWKSFLEIHHITYARSDGVPWTPARLARLRDALLGGRFALLNALDGETCVGSLLIDVYKRGASFILGGARDEARKLGAMPFLHYSAMQWAQQRDFKWYLVGPSFPAMRGTRFGDATDSKLRYGGMRWDVLAGEMVVDRRAHFWRIKLPIVIRYMLVHVLVPRRPLAWARRLRTNLLRHERQHDNAGSL